MKKECDANGLEYELLMQESAKERFLREIKGNTVDFNKHLVILKQKRQSASATPEATVGAPAPEEQNVAAPNPKSEESVVGAPLAAITSLTGKAAIAGLTVPKVIMMLRDRFPGVAPVTIKPIALPTLRTTQPPTTKFTFPPLPALPALPTFGPTQPRKLFNL